MKFGDYVRTRRRELGLTLRGAASALGVDPAYLSRVESGKVAPSANLVTPLAQMLHLDPVGISLLAGRVPDEWTPLIDRDPSLAAETIRTALRMVVSESSIPYGRAFLTDCGDRVIENGFPFEQVSEIAEAESWRKEIYRPIYHVHKWWAQRLGSVFRAILLGAAAPRGSALMELYYQPVQLPGLVVFDPFMGSGTTIGEAIKLGCTAIGRDINPVSYMAVKAALGNVDRRAITQAFRDLEEGIGRQIKDLYRSVDSCGHPCDVLYYFWVKQVPCPACSHIVDLFSDYIFAKHAYPARNPGATAVCPSCSALIAVRYDAKSATCHRCSTHFDPSSGPAKQATAVCPACACEFPIAKTIQATGAPPSHRMYAKLVLDAQGNKEYLPIDVLDLQLFEAARSRLQTIEHPFPVISIQDGHNTRQILNYGYRYWHELFNERQLLAVSLLGRAIAQMPEGSTRDVLYCLFSGTLEFNNMFASYKGEGTGAVRHMFSHHILKPERTPLEANLWGTPKSSGAFSTLFKSRLLRAMDYREAPFELRIRPGAKHETAAKVFGLSRSLGTQVADSYDEMRIHGRQLYLSCGSSASTDIPSNTVDLVITDPPFFDNVHYSELADFFYVWQQHFLGRGNYLVSTTRHQEEVQQTDAEAFSRNLGAVFAECHRVLKDDGLLIFTYHHSREEGWMAVARSVFSAGFRFVQAQPVKAEMSGAAPKAGAKEPIDIDMILVCRKWHHAGPRADYSTKDPIEFAARQIARLGAAGRKLSFNDVRVILMGQVLVNASSSSTIDSALHVVQAAYDWAPDAVRQLHAQQNFHSTNAPQAAIVQAPLFSDGQSAVEHDRTDSKPRLAGKRRTKLSGQRLELARS